RSAATAGPRSSRPAGQTPPRDVPSPPPRTHPEAAWHTPLKINYTNNVPRRGTSSLGFVSGRASAQAGCANPGELSWTGANCNPSCNPAEADDLGFFAARVAARRALLSVRFQQ